MSTTERGTAAIVRDIEQKRSRQAALEKRLEEAGTDLERLRTQQGRALADGTEGPKASEIQALAETRDGLRRALGVLADDLTQLENESKATAIAEAARHEQECIDDAVKQLAQLEELMRSTAEKQLLPRFDRLLEAEKAARVAQSESDRLTGASKSGVPSNRVEKRIRDRHGKTFALLGVLRAYVAGRDLGLASPSAPHGEQKPVSLAMS